MYRYLKNIKLTLLNLLLITAFISLGVWQLDRARQKNILLQILNQRAALTPYQAKELVTTADLRFYPVSLKGKFDNNHVLLLDNKTHQGHVGYEVYIPFHAQGLTNPILVDRGFLPAGPNRQQLPKASSIVGEITINGILNLPPKYVALGAMSEPATAQPSPFPMRVEFINIKALSTLLSQPLFPYVLSLDPKHPVALPRSPQATPITPQKHIVYAVQWFAFATTLLVLLVAL